MEFFTKEEFVEKYDEFTTATIPTWYISAASEMIFSQVSINKRDTSWDATSVPLFIKNASMEQLRFMLEHDLPFIDSDHIKAGSMDATIKSDYSTLALRMLANGGYIYRGTNRKMGITIPINQ